MIRHKNLPVIAFYCKNWLGMVENLGFRNGFFEGYLNCKQHVFILEPNCQFYTYTANNIWTRKNYQLTNRFFTQINDLDCQKSYFSSKLLWKSVFGSQSAIRQCNGGVSRALDYLIMSKYGIIAEGRKNLEKKIYP